MVTNNNIRGSYMKTNIDESIKKQVETICDDFLKNFATENDTKLFDNGGFADSKNFYEWTDNRFVINFFSISQDDFFKTVDLYKIISSEIKEKIQSILEIEDVFCADDCPLVIFKIKQ